MSGEEFVIATSVLDPTLTVLSCCHCRPHAIRGTSSLTGDKQRYVRCAAHLTSCAFPPSFLHVP